MKLTKEEIEELISNIDMNLSKVQGLADNSRHYLSVNKDGTLRKNSSYTYEMVAEAKERKAFLEGLFNKLTYELTKPTDDQLRCYESQLQDWLLVLAILLAI